MAYEFRYDFMVNAVDEAARMSNSGQYEHRYIGDRALVYAWMQRYWSPQQRSDWFSMYTMGDTMYRSHC